MGNERDKSKNKIVNATTIGMAQNELIQKNGEAASQMIQAYKGVRIDSQGKDLGHAGRSLKKISNYKINSKYRTQNIKQQSGFSAEVIKEARDNKEAIKAGDFNRTRTTDGIGMGNHQQYDHVIVDGSGNIIEGTGTQMKSLGIDKKGRVTVVDKIANDSKWEKYDGYIDIPENQYDQAIKEAEDKASELRSQANNLREKGNFEKAKEIEDKADRYENSKKKIRKSNVKEKEAIEARLNPKGFTAKEVLIDSHEAGLEAAKGAVILSGSISCAQNLYSVIYEGKSIDEAINDVSKTTLKSSGVAYVIGTTGTGIKAIMHSSKNEITRRLGITNAPAMIATGTIEVSKSIKKYAKGEIDEVELLEELGEKGTGMVAAGFGTAVGTAAGTLILPGVGSVVGGFVGSMVAYTISGVLYKETLEVLKSAKISEERRKVIEKISQGSIKEMKKYQQALTEYANLEYARREDSIDAFFKGIYQSILDNNVNSFFENINGIGKEFGVDIEFETFEEFDEAMNNDDFILIL